MKRNLDLIRTLLLHIESVPMATLGDCLEVDSEELAEKIPTTNAIEIQYHLDLIKDRGLINCPIQQPQIGLYFFGLTWDGHDFVDAVRDDAIWQKTKKNAEAVGGWTFDIIKDLAKGFIKTQLKKYTEVEIPI